MIPIAWARELMKLVREYGKAKQNLANYSGEEQDLAWTAVEAAHERILKKVYDKVDVSLRGEDGKRIEWRRHPVTGATWMEVTDE